MTELLQCLLPRISLIREDGQDSLLTSMAELLKIDTLRSDHMVHVHPALVLKEASEFIKPERILEGTNILYIPGSQVILN
jgi:hypothetical protein